MARFLAVVATGLLIACAPKEPPPNLGVTHEAPAGSPLPVALLGDWIGVAPPAVRGDTLTLRPDSTARGIIPWGPDRLVAISRWKVVFRSKDPAATRADWQQGHVDGGDIDCVADSAKGCVSLPELCLGTSSQYDCGAFKYTRSDSLTLQSGVRYVRAPRPVSGKE
ncbi:MAG: hypothetical protein ABJE47_24005 [bacterium]